jgi:nifR3 family TIM-barrel protein
MKKVVKKATAETGSFWKGLKKPFFCLAPMANVTDSVFRKMITKYGKPDVMWTEFVSADGLNSVGRRKLHHNLVFSKKEKPIVAQLFTGHPDQILEAGKLVAKLGFDGLDLNMGCPDKAVEKQGGGASLMKKPEIALEIIKNAMDCGLPVSVKTRIGYKAIEWDWIKLMLNQKLPALTIHLRTRKEMSDVPAHWEIMPEIVRLRDEISPETLIIGNGDVYSVEDGREKIAKYGCDGVMIGRGIFGKPWFFGNAKKLVIDNSPEGIKTRLKILLEHTKLFEKTFLTKKLKNFDVMKKHFKAYVSGWKGAKELRVELMNCKNSREVAGVVREYFENNQ